MAEIIVEIDPEPDNPREFGAFGKIISFHGKYDIGDKHDVRHRDFEDWDGLENHLRRNCGALIALPLYLMDHSGISISTADFGCRWDSGQIGFIYADRDVITRAFNISRMTKKNIERVTAALEEEVKIYDQYLRGDVWMYTIKDDEGNELESHRGFYSEHDAQEAAEIAVCYQEKKDDRLQQVRGVLQPGM